MSGSNNHQQQQPHNGSAPAENGEAWPSTDQLWGQRLERLRETRTPHYPTHARMHQVTVGNRDLTQEYASNAAPPLDYPNSFARSTSSLLPPDTRREMERLRPGLKEPAQLPNDSFEPTPLPAPPPAVQQQVAADLGSRRSRPVSALPRLESARGSTPTQNTTTAAPQPPTPPQRLPQAHPHNAAPLPGYMQAPTGPSGTQHAPAAGQRPQQAPQAPQPTRTQPPPFPQASHPSSSSGAPQNSRGSPPSSPSGPQQAPPPSTAPSQIPRPGPINNDFAVPGETYPQQVQRMWGIDIDNASLYVPGTTPIPADIQTDIAQICGLKQNARGFPTRQSLKEIEKHFLKQGGKLRMLSTLWPWYGDTRLLSRREWYYLASEGIGAQVP